VAVSHMPEMPQYLLEYGRADEARRSIDWRRGASTETEFAALQVQLDDHPSHKVIADYSSSLQCNWFLIEKSLTSLFCKCNQILMASV